MRPHLPEFPYHHGWLGGDAAYSVPFGDGRVLWLFGDTFIGAPDSQSRHGAKMINNSIGISEGGGAVPFSIRYFWRVGSAGAPHPFFSNDSLTLWPLDGFVHNKKLYLTLLEVKRRTDNPFDFAPVGVLLAAIDDPQEPDPLKWKIEYRKLSSSPAAFPGASIVICDEYVYFFGFHDARSRSKAITISRQLLTDITKGRVLLEHYTAQGWSSKVDINKAEVLFDGATSEFSVRYNRALKKWVAVYGGFPQSEISARFATELCGPWSKPKIIYDLRPHLKTKSTIAYAAKEHAQYSNRELSEVCVSFVCNSLEIGKVLGDLDLYRPIIVRPEVI